MVSADVVTQSLRNVLLTISELSVRYSTPSPARLVAVSKTVPAELILACYGNGQRHFGENYVHELEEKANWFAERGADQIRWHFIGRLQSNKIKKLCGLRGLWCVETVDNLKHCDILQSAISVLGKIGRTQPLNVFVQVNTSSEKNKGGAEPEEASRLVNHILKNCPNLNLLGLMTIGSFAESSNPEHNADFEMLRSLRDKLSQEVGRPLELSMGMSSDYQLAIKYGSTNVRVGSTIFGAREYPQKSGPP